MTYLALIARDPDDWFNQNVRLYVSEGGQYAPAKYLKNDGTWGTAEEGATYADAGVLLPTESIGVIAKAIEEFLGHSSNHGETEARVLREWLAVEKARVDKALEPR